MVQFGSEIGFFRKALCNSSAAGIVVFLSPTRLSRSHQELCRNVVTLQTIALSSRAHARDLRFLTAFEMTNEVAARKFRYTTHSLEVASTDNRLPAEGIDLKIITNIFL